MSLSWLDRLTLVVHPQRLLIVRQPWRGARVRQQLPVKPPASGETDWQPALAGVRTLLETHARRGARLRVVVADHFVRYALLPWSDLVLTPKSRQALALALMRNALGEKAERLEIAVDRPAFGRNGVAAGIDRDLLGGLRSAARAHRLRLGSVQPRWLAELASQRQTPSAGWFAAIDHGWLTLAGLRDGDLVCLHNHRARTGDAQQLADELAGLLSAEAATLTAKNVVICCRALATNAEPTLAAHWQTTRWASAFAEAPHA